MTQRGLLGQEVTEHGELAGQVPAPVLEALHLAAHPFLQVTGALVGGRVEAGEQVLDHGRAQPAREEVLDGDDPVHVCDPVLPLARRRASGAHQSDVLGLPETGSFAAGGDEQVAILDVGRATLELATPSHEVAIDRVEAGGRPSPPIRLAFEVLDTVAETGRLVDAGAELVAEPVLTPWRSVNARLGAPAGLQITLFQEIGDQAP